MPEDCHLRMDRVDGAKASGKGSDEDPVTDRIRTFRSGQKLLNKHQRRWYRRADRQYKQSECFCIARNARTHLYFRWHHLISNIESRGAGMRASLRRPTLYQPVARS